LVRAGVGTDAATLADLQRESTVFSPNPGETVELRRGDTVLLRLPKGPMLRAPLGANDDALLLTASAPVRPMYGGGREGKLTVQRSIPLDPIRARLPAARLEGP